MASTFDLVCRDCGTAFKVTVKGLIKDSQKRCTQCASTSVRQTFASFLRNGPLNAPPVGYG